MSLRRTCTGMYLIAATLITALAFAPAALAQQAKEITITYKGKQFQPSRVSAPANTPLRLRVKNLDAQAMEFESTSLRVEKVIEANSEGVIDLRPLTSGTYEFFDDFDGKSSGTLSVQ